MQQLVETLILLLTDLNGGPLVISALLIEVFKAISGVGPRLLIDACSLNTNE